jgi:hypothetical protein
MTSQTTNQEFSSTNQGWPSANIDDLPEPISADSNIGTEID